MPRSSRSSGPRPAARPAAPRPSGPSGVRGTHTMAAPPPPSYARTQPVHQPQPAAQPATSSGGGGLFGQMASTAAGVAVGSTVGHGLSNMLFGGSRHVEPAAAPAEPVDYAAQQPQQTVGLNCDQQSKDFLLCLEKTNDLNSCSYYLEQLKACQAAARPY